MNSKGVKYETDVVVVGSGPGGATVTRELTKRGQKVILCEAGNYFKKLGKIYSPGKMLDKGGMTFSKEGLLLNIGKTVGGQSMVFAASAFKPPSWLKDKYGIDLQEEVDELYQEIPIQPLPDNLIGPGARLLMESAQALGMDWQPGDKFIRPEKCLPHCGGCTLGCTTGAKWTAREYIEEAVENGAKLFPETRIDKVITDGRKAIGVSAEGPDGKIVIYADKVVLSAGGTVSPIILQRSGVKDVGGSFMVDPVLMVWGIAPEYGNMHDVPMSAGIHMKDEGILLMDMSFPRMLAMGFLAYSGVKGLAYMFTARKYSKLISIMVKVQDELHGRINADGSISKSLDDDVMEKHKKGVGYAKDIFLNIGVKSKDIFIGKPLGGHPGGTVRIGEHLDADCQTAITNCYCVDNSIIPEPWGRPPTVTIITMAKRLAKHLAADLK